MSFEIIKQMIDNSTWTSSNQKYVYKFINDKIISINGHPNQTYTLNQSDNKIELRLGSTTTYFIEYVNDFVLNLYNAQEKFRITPA